MQKTILSALLLAWLAPFGAAQAATDACATSRRLAMLEETFRLLLQGPVTPEAADAAFYAEILARSLAGDAPPGTAQALAELGRFAALVRATQGRAALAPEARTRHLAHVARLETARRAGACPDPGMRAASAGEVDEEAEDGAAATGLEERTSLAERTGLGKAGERVRFAVADFGLKDADWMQDASSLLSLRTGIVAIALAALGGLVWLLRSLAATWLSKLLRARPDGAARKVWNAALLSKIARDRRKVRHHVLGRFFDVTEQGAGSSRRIKVADISTSGAKLAWPEAPPKGSSVHLNLDGIGRVARVVWLNPHFCGVQFDNPLAEAELRMILAKPAELPASTGELEMF